MPDEKQKKILYYALVPVIIIAVLITGIAILSENAGGSNDTGSLTGNQPGSTDTRDLFPDKAYPEYATGYTVEYHGTYKVVTVEDPWGRRTRDQTFLLVQKGEEAPAGYADAKVVSIPIDSVITLSTTQLPHLKELDETFSIKGHNGIDLVYDEDYQELANGGRLIEIGSGALSMESQLNIEEMIELEPDLVFCSASNSDEYDNRDKLIEGGLTPAVVSDWMEDDPLGRAEWIKYFALFYNKEKTANEVFERIESNYTRIKESTETLPDKPVIFAGIDYQGTWYSPGGQSYVARLFSDAGGDYIYKDDPETGSLSLDFESVYDKAYDAEFWLNTGSGDSIEEILAMDSRYSMFRALETGNVYNYNARVNEYGGNDYWQSGVLKPDIILADLVKILHPDLLPDHELYYYKKLETGGPGSNK